MFTTGPTLDPILVELAWRTLSVTCQLMGAGDPHKVAAKRQGDDKLAIRRVWLHCASKLTRDDDDRCDEVAVYRAGGKRVMRAAPILSEVALAKITGLDRGTIETDIDAVTSWRERSRNVERICNSIESAITDIYTSIVEREDWLEWLLLELREDRASGAMRKVRAPKPSKAAPKPTDDALNQALAILYPDTPPDVVAVHVERIQAAGLAMVRLRLKDRALHPSYIVRPLADLAHALKPFGLYPERASPSYSETPKGQCDGVLLTIRCSLKEPTPGSTTGMAR